MNPRLRDIVARWRAGLGVLLHPPGASAFVALTLAMAGLEVGLNATSNVAEAQAIRTLIMAGPETFASTVMALPDPSRPAIASAVALLVMVLFGLGGWIAIALALPRAEGPTRQDWHTGLAYAGRALFWWGLLGTLLGALILGGGVIAVATLRAAMQGQLDGWVTYALPGAAGGAFFLLLVIGMYALSVTLFMGIVAIAEPQVSLWRLPARGHEVFLKGHGERFFRHMAWLLPLWALCKIALMQLTVPVRPLTGHWLEAFAAGSMLLQGLLAAGDVLVALFALVLAVELYRAGAAAD